MDEWFGKAESSVISRYQEKLNLRVLPKTMMFQSPAVGSWTEGRSCRSSMKCRWTTARYSCMESRESEKVNLPKRML